MYADWNGNGCCSAWWGDHPDFKTWCSRSIFLFYSLLFDSEVRTGNQIKSFIAFLQAVAQRALYVWSLASYINHKPLAFRLSSRRRFVHPPNNICADILKGYVVHEKLYLIFTNRSLPVHSTSWLLPFVDFSPKLWDEEIIQGCLEKPCLCWSTILMKLPYPVSFFGQGYGLLCVGYPLSDLEVETQDEDEVCQMKFESSHRISFSGGHIKSCKRFCEMPCAELFPWLTGILATIWTILCKGPLGKCTRTNLLHLPVYGHCHVATCCFSSHTVAGSVC